MLISPQMFFPLAAAASDTQTGLFMGGVEPLGYMSKVQKITISTTGNAASFGNLPTARDHCAAVASSTRSVLAGGQADSSSTSIVYRAIASSGSFTTFGTLADYQHNNGGLSNSTRGIFARGTGPGSTYITIATTGNGTSFGNLSWNRRAVGGLASTTRGVWAGGVDLTDDSSVEVMDYVTIATTGTASHFGDLPSPGGGVASCSNATVGVLFGGGYNGYDSGYANYEISYITIASTGAATWFASLGVPRWGGAACSSTTRAVFGGGFDGTSYINSISYVLFASLGSESSFGDLTDYMKYFAACSGGHGGL